MRICIKKSTNELISSCSSTDSATLISDATANGVDIGDIEVQEVTDDEYAQILSDQNNDSLTYEDRRRAEYPSIEDVTVALAEKEEGDSTMWDEVTAKRQAIKLKYPKS